MSLLLILKLLVVPCLVCLLTLAGRRWGPAVAGWLAGFPVVAGPILWFIAMERGIPFAQAAAASTLSAIIPIVMFGLSYAWLALRCTLLYTVLGAYAMYGVIVWLLDALQWPLHVTTPLVLLLLLLSPRLYPRIAIRKAANAPQANDLLPRMLAAAALVLLVTHFCADLGPHLSGLLAMFPVMTGVLAVFTHRQSGAGFAVYLLRGSVWGYYAFAGFCLVLNFALPVWGITWSFTAALCAACTLQAATRIYMQRHLPHH